MINTAIVKQFVHSKSQEDIIREYQSDPEKGLTLEEAALRLEALGRNVISEDKKKNLWLIFLSQFTNQLVYLLIVAAGLSFFFKEWLDRSSQLAQASRLCLSISSVRLNSQHEQKTTEPKTIGCIPLFLPHCKSLACSVKLNFTTPKLKCSNYLIRA